jgi:hypothetical protein
VKEDGVPLAQWKLWLLGDFHRFDLICVVNVVVVVNVVAGRGIFVLASPGSFVTVVWR